MTCTNTLALHEKLRKVLWLAVCHSPLPVFYLESGSLLLSFFGWRLFNGRFTFFALFTCGLFLDLNNFRFSEYLILNFIILDVFPFLLKLKSNDSLNLSNMFFNHEEFIHESELKLFVAISTKTTCIAEPFNHDN